MSLKTVETITANFLSKATPEVLAIKGQWGVGKTYKWSQMVELAKDNSALKDYSYVSLFGMRSINELRTAIFAKTRPLKLFNQEVDKKSINENWWDYAKGGVKAILHQGRESVDALPWGKNVTVGMDTLAGWLTKKTIICLDDFERLSQEGISSDELMGLISELKEERECKIVLIFNEKKLKDPQVYAKYREKIIDIELLYDPTVTEALDIALPEDIPFIQKTREYCQDLQIKNIRILKKISKLVYLIQNELKSFHPEVLTQAVHSVVILCWCYFDQDDDKPTLDFLKKWNRLVFAMKKREGDGDTIVNDAWINMLNRYGFGDMDEFDRAILRVIECGYLEETGFIERANELHDVWLSRDLEDSFSDAWKLYHNSFGNNEDELVIALVDSLKKSVAHVSLINLSSTTMLLRYLDRESIANELIDFYVDSYVERNLDLNFKRYSFRSDISDAIIWEKFEAKEKEKSPQIPLGELAIALAKGDALTAVQMHSLRNVSEEEFYDLFQMDHSDSLHALIANCLKFRDYDPIDRSIAERARSALIRIGNQSRLNAKRVGRHGIDL